MSYLSYLFMHLHISQNLPNSITFGICKKDADMTQAFITQCCVWNSISYRYLVHH